MLVCIFLNWKSWLGEEMEIFDQCLGLIEVDQDADLATLGRLKNGVEQPYDIELRKLAFLGVKKNFG